MRGGGKCDKIASLTIPLLLCSLALMLSKQYVFVAMGAVIMTGSVAADMCRSIDRSYALIVRTRIYRSPRRDRARILTRAET